MPSFREVAGMLRAFVRAIDTGQPPSKSGTLMLSARSMLRDLDQHKATEMPWTEFEQARAMPPTAERIQATAQAVGVSIEKAKAIIEEAAGVADKATMWVNSRYQVIKTTDMDSGLVWLTIKRLDQQPIRSWRDLQRIKNALVGPECEGMELFPATSRCVDMANQYHLWAMPDPSFRFPLGFAERMVTDDIGAGEMQEPLEAGEV